MANAKLFAAVFGQVALHLKPASAEGVYFAVGADEVEPTHPLGPSQVIYSGSGSYKLQPDSANRDFTANLTFTFAARDAAGHTVEAHQTYFREAVDPNSDTVFSLHFTMDDGTVLTGQVEVISPALAA